MGYVRSTPSTGEAHSKHDERVLGRPKHGDGVCTQPALVGESLAQASFNLTHKRPSRSTDRTSSPRWSSPVAGRFEKALATNLYACCAKPRGQGRRADPQLGCDGTQREAVVEVEGPSALEERAVQLSVHASWRFMPSQVDIDGRLVDAEARRELPRRRAGLVLVQQSRNLTLIETYLPLDDGPLRLTTRHVGSDRDDRGQSEVQELSR